MSSFTEKARETCEWPEVVVCDSLVRPELGTQTNPILIADDLAPLGSASNPIVIQVDEGWCRDDSDQRDSDADTVIMATPEFWGTVTSGNFAGPVKDDASIDSSSIDVPTGSLVCENQDSLQPLDMPTSIGFAADHKAFGVTEDSFDDPFWAFKGESVATDQGESEQSTEQGKDFEIEEAKKDRSVQLSLESANNINRMNCLGKTASTWDSSASTAIGDELASIYDHMEHCRNAGCLQAKEFFDGIHSPQNPLPTNLNGSNQPQRRSEGGRVTMRFHVPGFQKRATWPGEFLINQVVIRTAFFSPDIPCSLETRNEDDVLYGRGAVVVPLEGEVSKTFLTFSTQGRQDDHGTNIRASRGRSNGIVIFESGVPERENGANWRHGFTGLLSIELHKRWPPLASNYEEREDWFGNIALNIHSDGVDPKCFLTFAPALVSAGHNPHLPAPAPGNSVPAHSTTSKTISLERTDQTFTSDGKNLPCGPLAVPLMKRRLSHANQVYSENGHEESMERGMVLETKEPKEAHEAISITSDAITQETTNQSHMSPGMDLLCSFNDAGSTKRKLSHDEDVSSELRRSERLAKRART